MREQKNDCVRAEDSHKICTSNSFADKSNTRSCSQIRLLSATVNGVSIIWICSRPTFYPGHICNWNEESFPSLGRGRSGYETALQRNTIMWQLPSTKKNWCPIHTSKICLDERGLPELKPAILNWKTKFYIGFKKSLTFIIVNTFRRQISLG